MEDKKYETLKQEVRDIKDLIKAHFQGLKDGREIACERYEQENKLMKQVNEILNLTYEDAMSQIEREKRKRNILYELTEDIEGLDSVYNTVDKFVARYKMSFEEQDELHNAICCATNIVCDTLSKVKDVEIVLR